MTHRRCFGWLMALVLATALNAVAQPPGKPPTKPGGRRVVQEQPVANAANKVHGLDQDNMPEWASLNFRLYVRLGNGRNIIGIARNGNVFEKIVVQGSVSSYEKLLQQRFGITPSQSLSLKFVKASPKDPEVGIRLWHYDATGGYIFILFRDITSVKRLQVITPAELRELDDRAEKRKEVEKRKIRKRWEKYRKSQREAFKKQMEARNPADGKSKKAAKSGGTDEAAVDDADAERIFKRFHPSKGWTPGRKRVIEWRKWTLGVFPNEEEKEFLANYGAWKKAYDKWMSEYGESEKGGAKGAPAPKG